MVGGDDSVSGGCLLALDLTLRKCEMLLGGVGQSGSVFSHRLLLHIDHQEYLLFNRASSHDRIQNMGFY